MISGIRTRLSQFVKQMGPVGPAVAVLAAIVILLAVLGDSARYGLQYERHGLSSAELWRLVSAHLVHLGWLHSLMNVAALLLIMWLFGPLYRPGAWAVIALASGLAIDAGLWWFSPAVGWYVGLSGLLHGLATAGGVRLSIERRPAGYVMLGLMLAKIVWEQLAGALPMTEVASGGSVIVDAHLYGAIGGLLAAVALRARKEDV
ncbi:MAG: rhombosortase [Gammaproteobacteria bacterium]